MQDNLIVFPEPPPDNNVQLVTPDLPVSLTSLIGREQEAQALHALLLRPDVRLLTLTGTAGVGKTRLALKIARNLVHDFADGVYLVSLAPISDPAFVIPTIARRLGLTESGSQPILELLKLSQLDKQRLLVLDNFEQVIEAALLLTELLEVCPDLKILVTSREVLRLRGEQQFVVPPLALPDTKHLPEAGLLAQFPAVNLFLQRAQAIRADFQLTTDNAATIAQICLRLDGLPLAIELAAARIKVFTPQALLARLDRRLQVLTGGARDLPERQRTLRSTLAWSYELLPVVEQRLFRRVAVFVGGCTLETVEAVFGAVGDTSTNVLEGMVSLVDKSLLQQTVRDWEEPRFTMLETIREYGLEALTSCGEAEATRQAHSQFYLALAEQAEPLLTGPQQLTWFEHLEREHDNLRAALQWSLERGEAEPSREMALRLAGALQRFWEVRGHWSEGRNFLERALAGSEGVAAPVQVKALKATAHLAYVQRDIDRAEVLYEECLARCRELGDRAGIALSLRLLGGIASRRGNFVAASARTEESLALYREVSEMDGVAWSLYNLADVASEQGEYSRAHALYEQSLALHREHGNNRGVAWSLSGLALVLFVSQTDPATIHPLLEESLILFRELGQKEGVAWAIGLLGQVFLQQSDAATARSLLEESVVISREIGTQWTTAQSLSVLARVAAIEGDYAAASALYQESLAFAKKVSNKQLIASCLEGLADVIAEQGEPAWAARLWGAAEALRETMGTLIPLVYRAAYERSVATVRAQLGEEAFAAAWAQGRSMTPEQALAAQDAELLPEYLPPAPPATPPQKSMAVYPSDLTRRELEVLRLVAQGLTDAEVAERLVISPHTVHVHISTIFSKLEVKTRSAATRYAFEHNLV